jgi:hypothetical protein
MRARFFREFEGANAPPLYCYPDHNLPDQVTQKAQKLRKKSQNSSMLFFAIFILPLGVSRAT